MTAEEPAAPARVPRTGRIIATVLVAAAMLALLLLAVAGFTPALYLLVVAVVGMALVILGTRLH